MSSLSVVYALLFYFATVIFVAGLIYQIYRYAKTPAPLKIPTMPAPVTHIGVAARIVREITLFESLFHASKWTWLFGFAFHAALLLIFLRHLRYITEPVASWITWIQPFGIYAGLVMLLGLFALWLRRLLLARIRYISGASDHLLLALLILLGISGMNMKFVAHTDIVAVKAFMLGLIYFDWQPLPVDFPLLVHLALVIVLMLIFPFSKLLHAPGIFFSPTRNQVDNSREQRHLAPWAAKLDK